MSRTIVVEVHVSVRDDDPRTTDEVASWIERGLETGLEGGRVQTAPPSHLVVIGAATAL